MDAAMGSIDADRVPTLRDLIQRHIDRTGQSQRALGDRSGVKHQTLSKWFAGTIPGFPEPETIRKFAAYTGYSEQTVLLAAARTIGLRVAEVGGQLVNSLPPGTDSLSPEDVDAIRAVIRQLVEARRSTSARPPDMDRVEGVRIAEDPPGSLRPIDTPRD